MYAVILGGGTGTRFWPLSRERTPKQLLKITGLESMMEQTISRLSPLVSPGDIYIVSNAVLASEIGLHLSHLTNTLNFIIEPEGRNTAPAIGLAAIYVKKADPDAVMVVLPSDHHIERKDKFLAILEKAEFLAREDRLVTLGIRPSRPEPGYGYIKVRSQRLTAYDVERFVEKPDHDTACSYLEEGGYYWNSGMFIWKVSTILNEIERFMPDLYKGLMSIEEAIGTKAEARIKEEVFSGLRSLPIDVGVMEKSQKVVMIPTDIGWNDVGSFLALEEITNKDEDGNVISGNVVNIESRDSIIYGSNRLLAVVGLKNIIVVDTEDATLVCSKERAQDVKRVVKDLKERGAEEHVIHKTVLRPWGSCTTLDKGTDYRINKIVINPGATLDLKSDCNRTEQLVAIKGKARVICGKESFFLEEGRETYTPISTSYRIENPENESLHIIKVQKEFDDIDEE